MDDATFALYDRGYELHVRGGHEIEAEAAYREAIAAGAHDAWLNLGLLLWLQRGREADAMAALREAMASDDLEWAAHAALKVGEILDLARNDLVAARPCYEFAEQHGDPAVGFRASAQLALMLAFAGDREAAPDRIRSYAIWFGNDRE